MPGFEPGEPTPEDTERKMKLGRNGDRRIIGIWPALARNALKDLPLPPGDVHDGFALPTVILDRDGSMVLGFPREVFRSTGPVEGSSPEPDAFVEYADGLASAIGHVGLDPTVRTVGVNPMFESV